MSALAARFALGLFLFIATLFGGVATASAVSLNGSDLDFILEQIKRSEAHAAGGSLAGPGPNQIGSPLLPYGLRTVNGQFNNIVPGQQLFGSADRLFPRLGGAPVFRGAEPFDPDGPGGVPPTPTSYATANAATNGVVSDSEPRTISNLIVDDSNVNPAAVAVAARTPNSTGPGLGVPPAPNDPDPNSSFYLPNQAPDEGLSAPFNSWFTLFGQFFDHGLDLTTKGGSGTVIVPLKADDPLINGDDQIPGNADDLPPGQRFMVLTRATNQAGSDGLIGTNDDIHEHVNTTTPFVDQNQTYTSHPSHQVFLRDYELDGAGEPVSTGKLLEQAGVGGLATWADVKEQARTMLGIALDDQDVLNLPLVQTDQYGRFIPDPATGFARIVIDQSPLTFASGTPASPVDGSTAVRTKHAFLDDIAHHAAPFGDHDNDPQTSRQALSPDPEPSPGPTNTADDGVAATYDDEMLDAHFITGDGRGNENIGLTTVHHIFHAEHNLRVDDVISMIENTPREADWQLPNGDWNGERLFQAARFVTEMEYQHLVFEEFARKVQPQVNVFAGYEADIDPAITAEFAHAAYRFGHSMLTEDVARTNADGSPNDIGLIEAFLNPESFNDDGTGPGTLTPEQAAGSVVRGMTAQRGNEIDEFVTGALRNNLVGLPLDLATINIARGRDAGVPPLNALRRTFYAQTGDSALAPYQDWTDFGHGITNPESLVNFVAAYGTHDTITTATTTLAKRNAAELIVNGGPGAPTDRLDFLNSTGTTWASNAAGVTNTGLDSVDLWIGGLAERTMPFGGLLGSTFNFIFETQMEKLQDGDRLYYLSRTAGLNFLTELEGNSFAALIERTTDATHLPADVFSSPDYLFELDAQNASGPIVDDPDTDYLEQDLLSRMGNNTIRFAGGEHVLFGGTGGADRVLSGDGDDTVWGDDGNDRMDGGAGNDVLNGGGDDDILQDNFGDDNLKGGEGNDVMHGGQGIDLLLPGRGNDFVVAGSDLKETFGGDGDDYIVAGDGSDTVFGNEGADWIEGGAQADLLQGDNGDPFQEGRTGDDVIIGDGGNDDYDSEGGDDIMVAGPGVTRHEGMIGFDWVTHRYEAEPIDADLDFLGTDPPDVENFRDRYDEVEALSGWDQDDILSGDDQIADDQIDDRLTADKVELINGLAELLGEDDAFTGGNIIIGGDGSDLIEGRGGDDIIDGDAWLDVQLSTPDGLVDSMTQIQARMLAGEINPGQLEIVRTIRRPANPSGVDTAVFSDVRANYSGVDTADLSTTEMTITHTGGTTLDGTDTVRNVERLQFAGGEVVVVGPSTNEPATGAPSISDTTPTEGQALTASLGSVADNDGIDTDTIVYRWGLDDGDGFEPITNGPSFTPSIDQVGSQLRVRVMFKDNAAVPVPESRISPVTAAVAAAPPPPAPVAPPATPPPGGGVPLRVSGLSVPATVSADRSSPFTIGADVPAGASVLEIRVSRLLGGSRERSAAERAKKSKLIAVVVREIPEAGRYEFRLRDTKGLRNPKPGSYRIEIRTGSSLDQLGDPAVRTMKVKKAKKS